MDDDKRMIEIQDLLDTMPIEQVQSINSLTRMHRQAQEAKTKAACLAALGELTSYMATGEHVLIADQVREVIQNINTVEDE